MVVSDSTVWEGIISSAASLIEALAPRLPHEDRERDPPKGAVPKLHLPDVDSQSLLQALSRRNLSAETKTDILSYFSGCIDKLKECYMSHWHRLFVLRSCKFSESIFEALELASQKRFVGHCKQLELEIVAILDQRLQTFSCDIDAAAKSESESSEDGLPNHRGHSRLAVAILEKAYSHTTNITRAEKNRLAVATKLLPRQVTIWFQNRRNRKVAAAIPKAVLSNRPSTPDAITVESSSVTPTQKRVESKKRKADTFDDEDEDEDALPTRRMRSISPNRSPCSSDNRTSGAPSMISSTDSLASWSRGTLGKGRNYSTDSSVAGGEQSTSIYSKQGKTPTAISFDEQVQRQIGSSSFAPQEDASSTLLFSDSGEALLDLDDLGLDLNLLVCDLPSFSNNAFNDAFDFSLPLPSSQHSTPLDHLDFDTQDTPRQTTFSIPKLPTTPEMAADRLNIRNIDPAQEFMRAHQIEKWATGSEGVLEENDEADWFLNLENFTTMSGTSTPGGESSVSNEAVTPPDIFDFSLGGLSINHIMEENFETFQCVGSKSIRPQDTILDGDLVNRCTLNDEMEEVSASS